MAHAQSLIMSEDWVHIFERIICPTILVGLGSSVNVSMESQENEVRVGQIKKGNFSFFQMH